VKKLLSFYVAIGLSLGTASAAELEFNGFLSVAAGMTLSEDESYVADPITGVAYDDDISFKPDTMYALQATSQLGEGLSATAQIIGRGGNDLEAEIEWAYLRYEIDDNWSIKAGRMRTPFFMHSTYIDVGYTYYWIRPPADLYRSPLTRHEGIDLGYQGFVGDWDVAFDLSYGGAEFDVPGGRNLDFSNTAILSASTGLDWITFRGAYFVTELVLSAPTPQGILELEDDLTIVSLGMNIDYNNLLFSAEAVKSETDDGLRNTQNYWYVSGGYRFGDFTPHITFSDLEEDADGPTPAQEFSSVTAGLRWYFHPAAAFKIEYISRTDDSPEGFGPGDADLIVTAVDIVF